MPPTESAPPVGAVTSGANVMPVVTWLPTRSDPTTLCVGGVAAPAVQSYTPDVKVVDGKVVVPVTVSAAWDQPLAVTSGNCALAAPRPLSDTASSRTKLPLTLLLKYIVVPARCAYGYVAGA